MKKLVTILKSLRKPEKVFAVLRPEHKAVEAFISGGVQYYKFEKAIETPYERALFANAYYREFENRVDRDYLLRFCKKVHEILNSQRVKLTELAKITDNLQERVNFVIDVDLAWKLASVEYFDASENPYGYDQAYAMKKIDHWKKSEDIKDFFLRTPIGELISFLEQSGIGIHNYSTLTNQIKESHLKNLILKVSNSSSTTKDQKNSS